MKDGEYMVFHPNKSCDETRDFKSREEAIRIKKELNQKQKLLELSEEKELKEKWKEIIETSNDGDPRYSFELFKGLMAYKKSGVKE